MPSSDITRHPLRSSVEGIEWPAISEKIEAQLSATLFQLEQSQWWPAAHGAVRSTTTSGSTGQALRVFSSQLNAFFWMAFALREHLWHRRDITQKLANIRYQSPGSTRGAAPEGSVSNSWGAPTSLLYQTGPSAILNINSDISTQVEWLKKQRPAYLLTYPSNLEALARYCLAKSVSFDDLRQVRTLSEIVPSSLRVLCKEAFGVPLVDIYSSNEVGYIAIQCPDCQQYHVQSENVFCEVLNSEGEPCGPGDTGRVVLTSLHNYAMPLLRYEIRDYAVVGDPKLCHRGLPALKSILGRSRNMLTMPNGAQRWPTGFLNWAELAPIIQYQITQYSATTLEASLVTSRPLTTEDEERLTQSLADVYGFRFAITFSYLDKVRGHENGKYEEFVSKMESSRP